MMNQATISTNDLYSWAKSQGNLGIAVLFVRAFENNALTSQLVSQAEKVRDRQIADGQYRPIPDGKYVTRTERITRRPPVATTEAEVAIVSKDESILPKRTNPWPGTYTLQHEEGHTTFRVKVQPSDSKFAPGATVIELLVGQDNEGDYSTFGFLRDGRVFPFKGFRSHETLLERANEFLRDPEGDKVLVSKRCARCNRKLTTPESVLAGYGPECQSKGLR